MKKLVYTLALGASLQLSAVAHADPFTENFYLLSNSGGSGGYGNFTLNVAPPATGQIVYGFTPGYTLNSVNVYPTVGVPLTASVSSVDLAIFNNGVLTALDLDLGASGGFSFQEDFYGGQTSLTYYYEYLSANPITRMSYPPVIDTGIISLTPAAVTATPEPSSLMLLGTGILAGVGVLRRRCFPD